MSSASAAASCLFRRWSAGTRLFAAAATVGIGSAHASARRRRGRATQLPLPAPATGADHGMLDSSSDQSNLFSQLLSIVQPGRVPQDATMTNASSDVFRTQASPSRRSVFRWTRSPGMSSTAPCPFPSTYSAAPTSRTSMWRASLGPCCPRHRFLSRRVWVGIRQRLKESMNAAGTDVTVGDFVLTPFGWNITPSLTFSPAWHRRCGWHRDRRRLPICCRQSVYSPTGAGTGVAGSSAS